jgi:hypothetical protein
MGGHSEIQDAYNYILPDEYFGYQGAASCATTYATAPECAGSFGGAAWYAAVQEEHANTDFTIGNFYSLDSAGGAKMYSLSTTHNTTGVDNSVRGYFAYNTIVASTAQITDGGAWFEDTRSQAFGSTDLLWTPAVYPKGIFVNNILPGKDNTSCAYSCLTTQADGHAHVTYQTNMLPTNMVTPASNIQPTGWAAGGIFHNGVNTSYQFFDPSTIKPINRFLHGLTSPNFIAWTVFPVNTTTGLPVSGSQAIGQASALTDELTYYPPRFNPVTANMDAFTLRADLTTLGANDPTGPLAPSVTTTAASSITTTTATAGGNVTSDGGNAVTSRGTCYSTSANPTSPCTSDGTGTGAFSSSLTGLTASTTYHIRAFATNGIGTSYGSDLTFTTSGVPTAPTVTTTAASSITDTTAATGGNVAADGGASVTSRGVCYSTSANPTSPCTSNGTGTGVFSSSLSGLTASTLYHIRAFATNSVGTSYGSDLTFTTSAPSNSVTFGGNVSFSGSVAIQQ